MLDLTISSLALTLENCGGYEHRIQPIALRAATVFAENLRRRSSDWADRAPHRVSLDTVSAPAMSVDLSQTSDEQAAAQIASAWLDALALHLKV